MQYEDNQRQRDYNASENDKNSKHEKEEKENQRKHSEHENRKKEQHEVELVIIKNEAKIEVLNKQEQLQLGCS